MTIEEMNLDSNGEFFLKSYINGMMDGLRLIVDNTAYKACDDEELLELIRQVRQ